MAINKECSSPKVWYVVSFVVSANEQKNEKYSKQYFNFKSNFDRKKTIKKKKPTKLGGKIYLEEDISQQHEREI